MSTRKEKIEFFEKILADFHRKAGREHLPWRKKGATVYEIWVSEIMLQQTQVSRAIGYYEKFLKRFPTVESLAGAMWEEFLPYYQGLGYYARGRNMIRAAKTVVSEYGGIFPKDVKELEKLPGVGPYTAAAIASFAYGQNTIAWDTNLRRVIGRFFFGTKKIELFVDMSSRAKSRDLTASSGDSSIRRFTRNDRKRSVDSRLLKENLGQLFSLPAGTLNAAMMDFGSVICMARPKCGACPLSSRCVYFKESGKGESRITNYESHKKRKEGKEKIDWKNSQVFLTLHENHKKYYSPFKTKFAPFVIPASRNTRAGIKDWFRRKYSLELSVRPPHKKEMVDGKPTLFVNAQILLGTPVFQVFSKDDRTNH